MKSSWRNYNCEKQGFSKGWKINTYNCFNILLFPFSPVKFAKSSHNNANTILLTSVLSHPIMRLMNSSLLTSSYKFLPTLTLNAVNPSFMNLSASPWTFSFEYPNQPEFDKNTFISIHFHKGFWVIQGYYTKSSLKFFSIPICLWI